MLFTSSLALCTFVSNVFGSIIWPRGILEETTALDLPAVTAALGRIGDGIDKMVADLNKWEGGKEGTQPILDDSKVILDEINKGVQSISSSTSIGLFDAINILAPVTTLSTQVENIVSGLINKKDKIDAAGLTPEVLKQLQAQKDGSVKLTKAILGKLPSLTTSIAQPIADQITQKLDRAVQAFGAPPAAIVPASTAPKGSAPPKGTGPAKSPLMKVRGIS